MLQNKTILITGGGSGIGEALALQLALNNKVIICGRNEEKLRTVSAKHRSISYEVADVSDHHSIDKLFNTLSEKKIILDVLFNNAGVVELWDVRNKTFTSKEIFEKVNTNLSGAIAVTQHFINQADRSRENVIVNNTSEITIMPVPIMPLYSASKSALSVFTKSLRLQLSDTNFKVIELLTPGVDTAMPKQLGNTGKLVDPHTFANEVVRVIQQGRKEYAPGGNVLLMKFFQKFLPNTGLQLIDRLSRKQLSNV